MIYLRKFNENTETEKDLQSLFSDLLASLIDEDFNINVKKYLSKTDVYRLKITKGVKNPFNDRHEPFYWYDIRDNFIPFISFMRNDYTILDISFDTPATSSGDTLIINKEEIINNKIIDYRLLEIYIIFQVSL